MMIVLRPELTGPSDSRKSLSIIQESFGSPTGSGPPVPGSQVTLVGRLDTCCQSSGSAFNIVVPAVAVTRTWVTGTHGHNDAGHHCGFGIFLLMRVTLKVQHRSVSESGVPSSLDRGTTPDRAAFVAARAPPLAGATPWVSGRADLGSAGRLRLRVGARTSIWLNRSARWRHGAHGFTPTAAVLLLMTSPRPTSVARSHRGNDRRNDILCSAVLGVLPFPTFQLCT
jgi:hypothetical protein